MRRSLLIAAALVVGASLSPRVATAQVPHFGVTAGLVTPTGDFGKGAESGYQLAGLVDFSPPLAPIGFRGDVGFSSFPVTGSDDYRIISGTANITFGLTGVMVAKPYLIGGAGIYNTSRAAIGGRVSETNIGGNVGAGFRFSLGVLSPFVEARMHIVHPKVGSNLTYIPITFGLVF